MSTDDQVLLVEASDHTAQAVEAMIAAADISAAGGQDFAEWLPQVLTTSAAIKGSSYALIANQRRLTPYLAAVRNNGGL